VYFSTSAIFFCLFAEIALSLSIIKRGVLRKPPVIEKNPLTEKMIDYLEQGFTEDLSVSRIAETFSLSVSRVSHIFRIETGLSLKNYILHESIFHPQGISREVRIECPACRVSHFSRSSM